ncbi:hypothetical protein L596_009446 [Steinernema carpocapsae]|uniref:Uncharacterized protein n=1 Tax=Steinernema carpocapsae TaxID=34508 RepID=A0A4U5PFW5_STECR|nr:hypothetical protein L596_009446 [Steinernema carpocapsae]
MQKYLDDSKRFIEKEIKEELYASFLDWTKKYNAIDDHALKMEAKRLAEPSTTDGASLPPKDRIHCRGPKEPCVNVQPPGLTVRRTTVLGNV